VFNFGRILPTTTNFDRIPATPATVWRQLELKLPSRHALGMDAGRVRFGCEDWESACQEDKFGDPCKKKLTGSFAGPITALFRLKLQTYG
jgi:hypothetical protein